MKVWIKFGTAYRTVACIVSTARSRVAPTEDCFGFFGVATKGRDETGLMGTQKGHLICV